MSQPQASQTNPPFPLVPPIFTSLNVSLRGYTVTQGLKLNATAEILFNSYETTLPTNSLGVSSYYFSFNVSAEGQTSQQQWVSRNGTTVRTYTVANGACTSGSGTIVNVCTDWTSGSTYLVESVSTIPWTQSCNFGSSSSTVTTFFIDASDAVKMATQLNTLPGIVLNSTVFPVYQDPNPPSDTFPPAICNVGSTSSTSSTTGTPVGDNNSSNTAVIDCVYEWSSWGTCSALCGGGNQSRIPKISVSAANGGKQCPSPETQQCNLGMCTIDSVNCEFTWSDWTKCSEQCGNGVQYRTPNITRAGANEGIPCPSLETQNCTVSCPVDCEYEWNNWSTCTAACGGGTRTREPNIITQSLNGTACPLPEIQVCNSGMCTTSDVGCVFSWSNWSSCSASCGNGTRFRIPEIQTASSGNGAPCPSTEIQDCVGNQTCATPEDCIYTWSDKTECTAQCGGGNTVQYPIISSLPQNGGRECPAPIIEPCNTGICTNTDRDCVSSWTSWSNCSATCGDGIQTRIAIITVPASGAGVNCPNPSVEQKQCTGSQCNTPCEFTWSVWSNCSSLCGGGIQYRSAIVQSYSTGAGAPCPPTEFRDCNTGNCISENQNCNYSWSTWSDCSTSCGDGIKTRVPIVYQAQANNGDPCPAMEVQNCSSPACPVKQDCVVTWGPWQSCSVFCGGGTQVRFAQISVPASNGGACKTIEEIPCNTGMCTTATYNCTQVWKPWSECTVTCGGGIQIRTSDYTQGQANGGSGCYLPYTQPCNTQICSSTSNPVNCTHTWSEWGSCSSQCGGGSQTRTPVIEIPASDGGSCNVSPYESRPCNTGMCTQLNFNCIFTWTEWTSCTSTCGTGTQTRVANISTPAALGGTPCPPLQSRDCFPTLPPCSEVVDCVYTWSNWTDCSAECGGGVSYRYPQISVVANGGIACPNPEQQSCNIGACVTSAQNCSFTSWSSWSSCSGTCDTGIQTRHAIVVQPQANGGIPCPDLQNRNCSLPPCDSDCVHSWSTWTECTRQCGGGTKSRAPIITFAAVGTGKCPGPETIPCNTGLCPAIDQNCYATWSEWSDCSVTCGNGTQIQFISIISPAVGAGNQCPSPAFESRTCFSGPCDSDCKYEWSTWSVCNSSCGGGKQYRTAIILAHPTGNGAQCPLAQVQDCNTGQCTLTPQNCSYTWQDWTTCSSSCGNGTQVRIPNITVAAANGGTECPLPESQICTNPTPCPTNCEYTWGNWSPCSSQCSGGVQFRVAIVTTLPTTGGVSCPSTQYRSCNDGGCTSSNVDCVYTWGDWSECSAICGDGTQVRSPIISQSAANNGTSCPPVQVMNCNLRSCSSEIPPTDCVSTWGDWTECSKQCGGGSRHRALNINVPAGNGGRPCPPQTEIEECNTGDCTSTDQNCVYTWSTWTPCSQISCGTGNRTSFPYIITPASGNGTACPTEFNYTPCGTLPDCTEKTDCMYAWSEWTECSVECGSGGIQSRVAIISAVPTGGGASCPTEAETRSCNTGNCVTSQDCIYTWSQWTCTGTCGTGTSQRFPIITQPAAGGSSIQCPEIQTSTCTLPPCDSPCDFTWSEWTVCSVGCGSGSQSRGAVISRPAVGNGLACPPGESRSCVLTACPTPGIPRNCSYAWSNWTQTGTCGLITFSRVPIVNLVPTPDGISCPSPESYTQQSSPCGTECQYTWGSWGNCSVQCGGGLRWRSPIISIASSTGGRACPNPESEPCNQGPCISTDQDCNFTWTSWSVCSAPCGGGNSTRVADIRVPVANNGQSCPTPPYEVTTCNTASCSNPINCTYTWSTWSQCTAQCNGGTRSRVPIITTPASNGGASCPQPESEDCNTGVCTIAKYNCVYSTPYYYSACSTACGNGIQYKEVQITTGSANGGDPCPTDLIMERECYNGPCGIGVTPLMTCWAPSGSNWHFYAGYNNPGLYPKQLSYGSSFNMLKSDVSSLEVKPDSFTSYDLFHPGLHQPFVRVKNQVQTISYYLDGNGVTVNKTDPNFNSYRCPPVVTVIRPVLIDCSSPIVGGPQTVSGALLVQISNIRDSDAGVSNYDSLDISITITHEFCRPQTPTVKGTVIVQISDLNFTDNIGLQAFDLAYNLLNYGGGDPFFTKRTINVTPGYVPASQTDSQIPGFIVLDSVTPLFGSSSPDATNPQAPAPLTADGSDTDGAFGALSFTHVVIIVISAAIIVLLIGIITLYVLGSPDKK